MKTLARAVLTVSAALLISSSASFSEETTAVQPAVPQVQPVENAQPAPQPTDTQPALQPAAPPSAVESKPDPLIFRRTPTVDGQIESGEWDIFSSFELGADKGVTYADWDGTSLYLAAGGTKPVKLTVLIDANGDGWLHGGDNYKIEFTPNGASASVEAFRYDSKGTAAEPVKLTDALPLITKVGNDGKAIELAIPQGSLLGLGLKNGRKIGLRMGISFGETGPIPQLNAADIVQSMLVGAKSASLDPVEIELDVRDGRLAPGEELVGRLTIRNKSKEKVDAETFVVGGEGRAARYLNSEMIRIEGMEPGAKIKRTFRSKIPKNMPSGSWGLGAEVRSANARLGGTLVSFDVAPAYDMSLEIGNEPFNAGVYEWRTIKVMIKNNTQNPVVGNVNLTLPDGWQAFKNDADKMFSIQNEDGFYPVSFKVRLTEQAKAGTAPIKAEVVINKQTYPLSQLVEVVEKKQ